MNYDSDFEYVLKNTSPNEQNLVGRQHKSLNYEYDLGKITGLSMKILLTLLSVNDSKNLFLNSIQEKSGSSRSSFYYNIKKLNEKALIEVMIQITNDQRKKLIHLTPKGYNFLKSIYNDLKGNLH